jgi:cytidine deaminase
LQRRDGRARSPFGYDALFMTLVTDCLQKATTRLPAAGREALRAALEDPEWSGVISAQTAADLARSCGVPIEKLMLDLVEVAKCFALPPISGYAVGAIAQGLADDGGATGALYVGANLEFAGLPLGYAVHAEQAALTNAWLHGESGLAALAVSAAPCGHCRQFLYEISTADTLTVLMAGRAPTLLTDLLPDPFGPAALHRTGRLMAHEHHGLALEDAAERDPLAQMALIAANASYAPHSEGHAGVALETTGSAIVRGQYAENAAFNPSLGPMQSALAMWRLRGNPHDAISSAALVQRGVRATGDRTFGIRHEGIAGEILGAVSSAPLRTIIATGRFAH